MSDNTDFGAKVAIRRWALEQAGGNKASVLELFAGDGKIHDECYGAVAKHLAFDLKGVERGTWLQGDNRVLLKKHVNGWTLYDADAYVNPWIVLSDVCRTREPGRFVMVATCYCLKAIAYGGIDKRGRPRGGPHPFLRWVSGYNLRPVAQVLSRFYPDFIRSVWRLWKTYGVTVEQIKRVRALTGSHLFYYGIVAVKK